MLENILKNIPSYLAKVVSEIYILYNNETFEVFYDGNKIKYKKIDNCIYDSVESDSTVNNKKVYVFNEDDAKIIIVANIYEIKESADKQTILVVDDSDLIIKFFKRIFDADYNVISASNGLEAMDLLESNLKIDALFVDLLMPISSGFEVLEYLKKKNLFSTIPTCVISGDDSKDSIKKVSEYPVVDILNKPFSVDDVIKRLVIKMLDK